MVFSNGFSLQILNLHEEHRQISRIHRQPSSQARQPSNATVPSSGQPSQAAGGLVFRVLWHLLEAKVPFQTAKIMQAAWTIV